MKTKLIYISGGDGMTPAEIKSALDDIRKTLDLPADTVLFGLPVGADAAKEVNGRTDHRVLNFPAKKSILHVIKNQAPEEEITLPPAALLKDGPVDDEIDLDMDDSDRSITDLMGEMPGMDEDIPAPAEPAAPKKSDLIEEFGDFLKKDPVPPAAERKPRPFGRKGKGPLNILGDLFSYAGMAANDDTQDFALPDFIKRP